MNRLKIIGGTRSDGVNLCTHCRNATVMKGSAESQERIYCSEVGRWIRFKVCECSEFDDRALPSLEHMRNVAWILESKRGGREIGFLSASQWRKRHGYLGLGEEDY